MIDPVSVAGLAAFGIYSYWLGKKVNQPDHDLTQANFEEVKKELHEKTEEINEITLKLSNTKILALGVTSAFLGNFSLNHFSLCLKIRKFKNNFFSYIVASLLGYWYYRKHREVAAHNDRLISMDNAWQCAICMEREKNILYLPCNHVAICKECDEEMIEELDDQNDRECQFCRQKINSHVVIKIL